MPRSYWLPIIALGGCLTVALVLSGPGRAQNNEPIAEQAEHQTEAQEAPDITTLGVGFWEGKTGNPETYRGICQNPENNTQADLCQQWRTAEAANEQAEYARWQLYASLAGVAGLIVSLFFTGWAARAASRAAVAAEKAVKVTSETAQRELRAFIHHDGYIAETVTVNGHVMHWKITATMTRKSVV